MPSDDSLCKTSHNWQVKESFYSEKEENKIKWQMKNRFISISGSAQEQVLIKKTFFTSKLSCLPENDTQLIYST